MCLVAACHMISECFGAIPIFRTRESRSPLEFHFRLITYKFYIRVVATFNKKLSKSRSL